MATRRGRAANSPTNDLGLCPLAAENRIGDCSWVKPGKVAPRVVERLGTGVDFEPGINTRTHKAYIDFAADYGLEYVAGRRLVGSEGGDVMSVVEQIDLPELVRYADAKGVGLMLWVVGNVLDAKLEEACSYYAGLGIRGFKVDFIDRDDQKAVSWSTALPGSPPRTARCSISTAFTNPRVRTAPIPISSISKASSGWRNSSEQSRHAVSR